MDYQPCEALKMAREFTLTRDGDKDLIDLRMVKNLQDLKLLLQTKSDQNWTLTRIDSLYLSAD